MLVVQPIVTIASYSENRCQLPYTGLHAVWLVHTDLHQHKPLVRPSVSLLEAIISSLMLLHQTLQTEHMPSSHGTTSVCIQ